METLQWLRDRAEVSDTVLRFARALDEGDWLAFRNCLAEELYVDYTEFRQESAHMTNADDFVAKRAKALNGLHMQHLSTNHLVTINGDQAECKSCFLIHRIDEASLGEKNFFDSAGHYIHGLLRVDGSWRINHIKQSIIWNRGNSEIHGGFRSK